MKLLLLFLVFMNFNSWAQENPFLTPMGAHEGIAGNTGIGRDGSVGSVIYNPAGMASIKSSKLSASGSAFSQNHITTKSSDGSDDIKYFQTVPAQITTIFTNPNFNWAFSILVPNSTKFDSKRVEDTVNFNDTVEDHETVFGPSAALKISKDFSIGLSIFGSKRDYRLTSSAFFEDGTGAIVQSRKQDISGLTAYPILGLLYAPSSNFSAGLKFLGPSTSLSGKFEDNVKSAGDNTSLGLPNSDVTEKGKVTFQKPMELGVGFSARTSENIKLYFDVTNQFSKEYEVLKDDVFGETTSFEYKTTQRYNFAVEYMTSHTDAVTFGLMYNPDPMVDSDLNFMGATLGYRSMDKIADSSFGLFYNQGSSDSDGIETKQTMVGLFISSSINFLN
jgi:long-subunit fatty acid transport protein